MRVGTPKPPALQKLAQYHSELLLARRTVCHITTPNARSKNQTTVNFCSIQ